MKKIISLIVAFFLLTLTGCKHDATSSAETDFAFDEPSPNASLSPTDHLTQLLNSKSFTGSIALTFADEKNVRLRNGKLVSSDADLQKKINDSVQKYRAKVKRHFDTYSESELTASRHRLKRRTGVWTADPNSHFTVSFTTIPEAVTFIEKAQALAGVEYISPILVPMLTGGVMDQMGGADPLYSDQTYLKPKVDDTGKAIYGLNIEEAWPITKGNGVTVFDIEHSWNFTHEELLLNKEKDMIYAGSECSSFLEKKEDHVQHGTAVVGVVRGWWNQKGINGIAEESDIKVLSAACSGISAYAELTLNFGKETFNKYGSGKWLIEEGDVVLVELAEFGASEGPDCIQTIPDIGDVAGIGTCGMVIAEASKPTYDLIKKLTDFGAVVVEPAGNGGVNLNTPAGNSADPKDYQAYLNGELPFYVKPGNDSGAIIVGSIDPKTGQRNWDSNCGEKIDIHAWGQEVMTAGYGDYGLAKYIEVTDQISGENLCILAEGVPGYNENATFVDMSKFGIYLAQNYPSWKGKSVYVTVVGICKDGTYSFDNDSSTPEIPPTASNKNQFYTNEFSGTSSAGALVAGGVTLIQSLVRSLYHHNSTIVLPAGPEKGTYVKKAYFTSTQMRTMLKAKGHAPLANIDCPIGKLPDIKATVDGVQFGEFVPTITVLKDGEPVAIEAEAGKDVGTILEPIRAKKYDLDGDGRAELIRFEQDRWVIDRSSQGTTEDHFGSDDLIFNIDATNLSTMVFPVVADYNSDGLADLALYDSLKGNYYIKYSTPDVMASPQGTVIQLTWDSIIDYSVFADWEPFARPVPGYYSADDWLDIGFQGPKDTWWIDYGKWEYPSVLKFMGGNLKGELVVEQIKGLIKHYFGKEDTSGALKFDKIVTYLSPDLYSQAPGWAFLGGVATYDNSKIIFKHPDGLPTKGHVSYIFDLEQPNTVWNAKQAPNEFCGNDTTLVPGYFDASYQSLFEGFGYKNNLGEWAYIGTEDTWITGSFLSFDSSLDFGSVFCRPIPGDYDGDDYDDAAVQCNTTGKWKILYSDSQYAKLVGSNGLREVGFAYGPWILPGYVFPGGIAYQEVQELYKTYKTKIEDEWEKDCAYEFSTPTCPFDIQYPEFMKPGIWPPPIGPFFAQCVAEQPKYAPNLPYCWDK